MEKCKKKVRHVADGSLHVIVDIWSSRQQKSVFGFKLQFIDLDWQMVNVFLGFKEFSKQHTAENMKKIFQESVINAFGIQQAKVSSKLLTGRPVK